MGLRKPRPDPPFEGEMARHLATELGREYLLELYQRHVTGDDKYAQMMRRVILKAVARRCGDGLLVGSQVGLKHPETFVIGTVGLHRSGRLSAGPLRRPLRDR